MLKGPFRNPDDYPSRETALAIVAALKTADDWTTVADVVGIKGDPYGTKAQTVAGNCYAIYGYPELDPVALARWTAEVSMRPGSRVSQPHEAPNDPKLSEHSPASPAPACRVSIHVYGFNRAEIHQSHRKELP